MDFEKAFLIFAHFVFADKGYFFNKSMRFEKIDKSIEMNNTVLKTPVFIRLIKNINSVYDKHLHFLET